MKSIFQKYHLTPIFCLLLILFLFYFPVLFLGRTLQGPEMARMDVNLKSPPSIEKVLNSTIAPQIFNIEMASSAYSFFPSDIVVANTYRNGELPLWNPYQGLGTPLAAGFESGAFFPYRVLQDLFPTSARDSLFVFQIWLAGIFSYLFFTRVGIDSIAAFFGATLYMSSGVFTWYYQVNFLASVAMLLPLLLYLTDQFLEKITKKTFVALSCVVALVLYAGSPEAAFYAFLLSGTYFLYKLINQGIYWQVKLRCFLIYLLSAFIGLLIAAPIIFIFIEFCQHAYSGHTIRYEHLNLYMTSLTTDLILLKSIFFPKLLDYANSPSTVSVGMAWDLVGGYVGMVGFYFILIGFLVKEKQFRSDYLFFLCCAAVLLLMNYGFIPFYWIAQLPGFNLTIAPKWNGMVWVFSLAACAAYGFQTIKISVFSQLEIKRFLNRSTLIAGIFLYFLIVLSRAPYNSGVFYYQNFYHPDLLILVCSIFSVLSLLLINFLILNYRHSLRGWVSCVLISIIELQFCFPKGNYAFPFLIRFFSVDNSYIITQLLYLFLSLLLLFSVYLFVKQKTKTSILIAITTMTFSTIISLYVFPGYPKYEAVAKSTPFIDFLTKHVDNNRVFGLDGIMNQMYSSVYKLSDLRNTSPLLIKTYQNFTRQNIIVTKYKDFDQSFITNYFYAPSNIAETDHFVKFKTNARIAFDFTGTKYFIAPNRLNGSWFEKRYPVLFVNTHLVYSDQHVNIYENEKVLPRVFFVSHIINAPAYKEAQNLLMRSDFDRRHVGILEEPVAKNINSQNLTATANIIQYNNNSVTIIANASHNALLVLTDIYYPGWTATVDDTKTKIYRVDGLVRGVLVPAGRHEIKFYYFPTIFKIGLVASGFALFVCILLLI